MSKKFKKREAPTSFSDRWFRRISTAKPSTFVVTIIVVSYTIFFFSGGLLTIISQPLPSAYYGGKFYFLYPELGSQFISDTIIAIMLYVIGFAGLLSIYQSTKYAYKPRQAYMMMVIGVTLLLIAYIFIEDAIHIKIG
ncbi:hypothetical protein G4O51_02235 [Candidatus Bathyarchaeota archaeon A05DMB-2]|nr:hypothetical protein [Candidatus Bathyarchaeota archaeon A05DMB-2]